MNTIRTTSEASLLSAVPQPREAQIPYTVVGGPRWDRVRRYSSPLTLLVLSRGDRLFRPELLKDLQSRGIGEILWVERHEPSADVDSLARDFPDVRFLLIKAPSTAGEMINIGIAESRAPVVLSLWSDTRLSVFSPSLLPVMEKSGVVCTVPVSRNAQLEPIPSWQSPVLKRRRLSLSYRTPRRDGEPTLVPFDYCGIYNREKFAQSGGFDSRIANPYWQKLDFGFRCFLWGESVRGTTGIALTYTGPLPRKIRHPDRGYKLFWLKNMAVRLRREMGVLPARRMLDYIAHSDTGPLFAIQEFRSVRGWVHTPPIPVPKGSARDCREMGGPLSAHGDIHPGTTRLDPASSEGNFAAPRRKHHPACHAVARPRAR